MYAYLTIYAIIAQMEYVCGKYDGVDVALMIGGKEGKCQTRKQRLHLQ
jgi:hypothetical protein